MSLLLLAAAAPVLHYVRSNSDGTEPETVIVFADAPGSVRVFKGREPCTSAAYVTAELDSVSGQTRSLVGGRLGRDLAQHAAAWFSNPAGRAQVRLGSPESDPVFDIAVSDRWFLYDFDFADWIARPPAEILSREDFSREMVLLLTGDDEPTMGSRGTFQLTYAGTGEVEGRGFIYYRAGGPALGGGTGSMWFDAVDGRLLAARLPLANHAEYSDFAYHLVHREDGEDAWRAALASHWEGCPVPAEP